MAPSIHEDSQLAGILDFRRNVFLETLPTSLSATTKEERWATYLLSLSRPSALSRNSSLGPATASPVGGHTPPVPEAAPQAKRRRIETDASQSIGHTMPSRQPSSSGHPSGYQDGTSSSITTGARSSKSSCEQWYNTNPMKQPQATSNNLEPLVIPRHQPTTIRKTQAIPVRECDPGLYRASYNMTPIDSSNGQTSNQSSSTLQPLAFMGSSPHSSSSGISWGQSTSPTSIGSTEMRRIDSLGGTSVHNGFKMMRLGSSASMTGADQAKFSNVSAIEVQQDFGVHLSPKVSTEPPDPVYDISQAGSQFGNHRADESVSNMQRQVSSNSRQLHPKVNLTPSMSRTSLSADSFQLHPKVEATPPMSRTPSSADSLEVIRVPSSDGSFKEAIKISPAASSIRPSSPDKVKCKFEGCEDGFKGVHEMQRHFDRTHGVTRHVFVCAPLADDPDFLFKTNCKRCLTQKRYNEDYNAGEHLRRMHFNPKQPKTRRGQLRPEERRGGKGGGTEPPMPTLRNYMITFEEDMNGVRVSDPRRLNPTSNLIMPIIVDASDQTTAEDQVDAATSPGPVELGLNFPDGEYEYLPAPSTTAQPDVKPRFAGSDFSVLEQAQLDLAVNAMNTSTVAEVSSRTEDPTPCDRDDALANDPLLFDSILSDNSAMYGVELADLLSPFP